MISRCSICDGHCRPVPGDGPEPCEIMAIGERPGRDENKLGRPFIGKSGRELNENYLWLAGLRREDIRLTNTVKCFAEGNRKPSEKEIQECAGHHIPDEIERCNPSLVLLLGSTACALCPDIDLDTEHGIPRHADIFGWSGPVVPMYHPAAGLHDTGKMIPMLEDWERLGKVLRGEWFAPEDPYPSPDYRLLTDFADVWDTMLAAPTPGGRKLIAIDTERHGDKPFSVQYSLKPGTGYMLLDSNREVMRNFAEIIEAHQPEVILHNAGQDMDCLDRMGIHVKKFRDTMQEAYHLGNLPQGLKPLAYRLLGIRMTSYMDVVMPHSRDKAVEWMVDALNWSVDNQSIRTLKEYKKPRKDKRTGQLVTGKEDVKPGELERALRRIIRYTMENPEYNPWEKLQEFREKEKGNGELLADAEGHVESIPIAGIANVPIDEAVRYGCMDADMTLRVELELERLRREKTEEGGEWCVGEGDEDR